MQEWDGYEQDCTIPAGSTNSMSVCIFVGQSRNGRAGVHSKNPEKKRLRFEPTATMSMMALLYNSLLQYSVLSLFIYHVRNQDG